MSVTVTCPECGAKLKLKSRASLGKERPCPKCEVPFVLSEEYNDSVYDLDARGAAPSRSSRADSEEPKMLKRGSAEKRQTARDEGRPTRGGNGSSLDFSNRPLAIGLGAGGLISAGMLLAWLVMGGGGDPAPSPDQETVSDSGITQGETAGGSSVANPRSGVPRRTGENPIPGREPPRTQPIGQTVDLLAGVNVSRNKGSGNWDLTAGRLQSSDGDAKLQLPVEPPGDYRFEATVTREAGDEQINIILPVGDDRQVMFVADWIGSGACGLEAVNGQPPGEGNPTRAQYPMENNQNYRLHAEIRRDAGNVHIQAGIDGGNLVDWKGPVTQLSIFGGWAIPSKNAIGLASGSGRNAGTFVSFREVRLTNLGGSNSSSNPPLVASNTNPTTSQPTTPNIPPTTKPHAPEPPPPAIPPEPGAGTNPFTPDPTPHSDGARAIPP
ncbi:MAG: hypothetical protein H8E37_03765, partial [Planctomycetes bacterium]|nr:hypothetical protein [Planctomycetota bacterium]